MLESIHFFKFINLLRIFWKTIFHLKYKLRTEDKKILNVIEIQLSKLIR